MPSCTKTIMVTPLLFKTPISELTMSQYICLVYIAFLIFSPFKCEIKWEKWWVSVLGWQCPWVCPVCLSVSFSLGEKGHWGLRCVSVISEQANRRALLSAADHSPLITRPFVLSGPAACLSVSVRSWVLTVWAFFVPGSLCTTF